MNHTRQQLLNVLEKVAHLLGECQHTDKASWFREHLAHVQNCPDDRALTEIARSVQTVIGGIGSFSDLSLIPGPRSCLSIREAHDLQWELVDELDRVTAQILT